MTTTPENMMLQLGFDRELASYRGNSVRYLVLDLTAPTVKQTRAHTPLNLAIVIDASGSMEGAPLACAKQAALGVVERLAAFDRLSIVSFAEDAITHLDAVSMDHVGQDQARRLLSELVTRGSTDLAAGWLNGAECVARQMQRMPTASNRVILLSDGHANQGVQDPQALGEIAGSLRVRGVFSSTVGIGDGYSPLQIQAIAEHGGGRMHDAERPEEIVEVVLTELGDVVAAVAENVQVTVELPPAVEVDVLGTFPLSQKDNRAVVSLGGFVSGAKRQVVLRVTTPPGQVRERLSFAAWVTWRRPGEGTEYKSGPSVVALQLALVTANRQQSRNEHLSLLVARLWLADVVRRAVVFNREADYQQGQAYLRKQVRLFAKYCEGLPETADLVQRMRKVLETVARPWSERSRKEIGLANYKMSRSECDVRAAPRPSWDTFLPPE